VIGVADAATAQKTANTVPSRPGTALTPVPPGALDLWITPPAYTGAAPILPRAVMGADGPELAVPVGSTLLAQVTGGRGVPEVAIDDRRTAFEPVDERAYRHSSPIQAGSRLVIRQGSTVLGAWPMRVVPDNPPTVAFPRSPQDVVDLLGRICDYLERNEPTNPAPLLIRRAQRLMTMNFVDILRDVAPEGVAAISRIAGLPETK